MRIADHYNYSDKYNTKWLITTEEDIVSREEFDNLKKEIEELRLLLLRAKKYDEDNNEPNCEKDEKTLLLRKIAEKVGVDLSEVFS